MRSLLVLLPSLNTKLWLRPKRQKRKSVLYALPSPLFSSKTFQLSQVTQSYAMSLLVNYAQLSQHLFDGLSLVRYTVCRKTHELIVIHIVGNDLYIDISNWAKAYLPCKQSKVHHHTAIPLQDFKIPTTCFRHIHMDIVGPLLPSKGHSYLFTMVDCFYSVA